MWAYEARRLFRDQLVGDKAVDQFDAILGSVLQSDWSASLSSLDQDGGAFYVAWGSPQLSKTDGFGNQFGRPLGRLSATDMQEVVARAVTTFGKHNHLLSLSLSFSFSLFLQLMESNSGSACFITGLLLMLAYITVYQEILADFNLAVCQSVFATAKEKSTKFSYTHIFAYSDPILKSTSILICNGDFGPTTKLIPANISCYTVHVCVCAHILMFTTFTYNLFCRS